jgi:Tol biopolymer transport system component
MKKNNLIFFILVILITYSCKEKQKTDESALIIQRVPEIKNGLMTPETLWYFGRIGEFKVSPDEKKVVFTVAFYDIVQNKGNREIFIIDLETSEKTQLTSTPFGEFNIEWNPDSETIGYLYPDENGEPQLFEVKTDACCRSPRQISFIEGGISGFSYSPT